MSLKKKSKGCLKGCGIALVIIIALCCILIGIGFVAVLFEDSYDKALTLYDDQEYIQANKQIDALIAKDSINSDFYFLKGKIAFELHDTIASQKNMSRAIAQSDSSVSKFEMCKAVFNWKIQKKDTVGASSILIKTLPLFKHKDFKRYIGTHFEIADIFNKVKLSDSSVMVLNRLIDSISIEEIDTLLYQKTHYIGCAGQSEPPAPDESEQGKRSA